ncbi:MAG: tRNA-dihydrouridine synthase family protein [Planctomycetes bacterium]|nr:tRNA-dihydrouridine synthase family protein [Planctomycetota bacterium]
MLLPNVPALILAPMEGVTDAPMRALQGELGAFTFAVSEFFRINQTVPNKTAFYRHVPELRNGAMTPTGVPVQVQILGGNAGRMAEAAVVAVAAGAKAIDINFGCPARTVNRHDGGATLLQHPKRIREIVGAVRSALPSEIPVSAKLRLGWDSIEPIDENAAMAAEGGANWLTIHARTRSQGYAPPVFWAPIGRVRESLKIPVVANGDIWTLDDFRRCRDETGCTHYMLGRGAMANPRLARQVARELGIVSEMTDEPDPDIDWLQQMKRLVDWTAVFEERRPGQIFHRMKQWLNLAATYGSFARFDSIKRSRSVEELFEKLPEPV